MQARALTVTSYIPADDRLLHAGSPLLVAGVVEVLRLDFELLRLLHPSRGAQSLRVLRRGVIFVARSGEEWGGLQVLYRSNLLIVRGVTRGRQKDGQATTGIDSTISATDGASYALSTIGPPSMLDSSCPSSPAVPTCRRRMTSRVGFLVLYEAVLLCRHRYVFWHCRPTRPVAGKRESTIAWQQ